MTTPESLLEQIALDQRAIADLNQRIADNKALLDACLEDGSLEHLLDEDGKAFRYTTITLSRSKRTTWKYSSQINAEIDAIKLNAQGTDQATQTTTHFWTVRAQ